MICEEKTITLSPSVERADHGRLRHNAKRLDVTDFSEEDLEKIRKRFWSKVNKTDDCWLWIGTRHHTGYGAFSIRYDSFRAHRVSYMLVNGDIPYGLVLDHLCRNKLCVKPSHLQAVTDRTNNERGLSPASENMRKVYCCRGHSLSLPNKYGKRQCLTCRRNAIKKRYWINPSKFRKRALESYHKCKNAEVVK
jgi:hypothetical protein